MTPSRQRMSFGAATASVLLALLCAVQLLAILRAPAAWLPREIAVTLQPGTSIVLGRAELGAPRAAARQLTLRRDAGGAWWLRNLEPVQPIVLRRGDARVRSSDVPLARGQQIQTGAARFDVLAQDAGSVTLSNGERTWRYDGATLLQDGALQLACPDAPLASRVLALWNRITPYPLGLARPVSLGGLLYCGNRLASSTFEAGTASLGRLPDGRIALSVRGDQPVLVSSENGWEDAAQRDQPLAATDAVAVGRTVFTLVPNGDMLHLTPSGQVALSNVPQVQLPDAVRWQWQERTLFALPAPTPLAWAAAIGVLLLGAVSVLPLLRQRVAGARLAMPLIAALVAATATLLLIAQRSSGAPGVGVSLLLAWATLWLTLRFHARISLLSAAAVLLLGTGLLVQLEMGLGASDTAWLRHFQNSTALLGLGLPGTLLLLSSVGRNNLSRPVTERVLLVLAGIALVGVLLQVCFGSETGVFDIQPFEFAKFALAALSAHCLALVAGGATHQQRNWRFWLRMAAPVLLFVFLLGVALVRVDDYSPLVLLLVWSSAMALVWCASRGRRAALVTAAVAICLLVAGGAALRSSGAFLGALGFYPERFQVWSAPTVHPHTGQQMLLGARAIAQGGWLGADKTFGLAALGGAAGDALAIPAIQDDFAPAFLLQRHGLAAGLALWTLQALFLVALVRVAADAWGRALAANDFRRAWLGRFQCFALCGGAAFVAGHLLLAWGTNLAMFPIMGQPMSFLSAGGSHLLFFICPLLAFGMASTPFNEEIQSCRSMSNTKSWAR
jgi:cell division protein FtsW